MAISKLPTGAILDNSITNAKIADDAIGVADLAATGTPSTTTFLRGDNAWATPIGGVTSVNGVTGAITAAHIATAVEAASGSNTFTDADHTKLSNIEGSATADQTNSEIKTAVEAATSIALGGSPTTTTQAESDNTTKLATTAYVTSKITTLIGGAPSTLNDLNELAAAINDDANYNSTLTTALATKLPLAGGTMTGNIAHAGAFTIDAGNNIALDNGSGNTVLLHNGSQYGLLTATGSNLVIKSGATTALTFSNQHVTASGNFTVNGNILTAGTVDGVDIQTLNTTAGAALPKAGGSMTGNLELNDNVKAAFGNSGDLEIFHDTNQSIIREIGTGRLILDTTNGSGISLTSGNIAKDMISATKDAEVSLYHDGNKKFETEASGVLIQGEVDGNGGGFRIKSGSATLGGIFKSGTIEGNSNADVTVFAETGKMIHLSANGSATKVLSVSANGLLFNGDTAAANALDDYEEGNHATAFTAASSGSITVGRNDLAYTKIGNVVHCTGEIQISSVSSPNGGTRMTLPFVVASHTVDRNMNSGATMNTYNVDYYENNPPVLHFSTGSSYVTMMYLRDNNPFYDYNAGAGDTYFMSFTYKTN
jgi:hypothetical protein